MINRGVVWCHLVPHDAADELLRKLFKGRVVLSREASLFLLGVALKCLTLKKVACRWSYAISCDKGELMPTRAPHHHERRIHQVQNHGSFGSAGRRK